MGITNNREPFNTLMKQLEYLNMKNNKYSSYSYKKDEYYDIYGKMSIEDLICNIRNSLNECENNLNEILNSGKYSPGSVFKEREIDNFINKIISLKNKNQKYNYYFEKAMQLLNKIKSKDLEIFESKMDIESISPSYDNNIQNKEVNQKLVLINKQDVIQAQELALLNDNFGRALASLECYANKFSKEKTKIFDYYNMFDLGNKQSPNELQKKAFVQTKIFSLAYEDYIKKHNYYNAPENISLSEIAIIVNKWMYAVPKEHQIMYQGMINIINSLNNTTFDNKFNSYAEKYKNAKMDPKKISSFAPGVYYYNKQRCDDAKNKFLEEGKITSKLNINQSYKNDKKAEELYNNILNNNKNVQEAEEYKDLK
jgi:hypothetical protein